MYLHILNNEKHCSYLGYLDYQIPDSIAGRNLQNQYILVNIFELGCLWALEWGVAPCWNKLALRKNL